ncbi:MAG TPA: GIY-YIG nuclease family protein [Pyrinomonadaceae bacterium]|nr:GIY-YIG nuclease family protein [Pyrinomonadaceae bacterium]
MDSGCYQLKIRINEDVSIEIGALGVCEFEQGNYVYTGSAMRNLSKRIARHKRKDKQLHWHIDYLLAHPSVELNDVVSYISDQKEECFYNRKLLESGAKAVVAKFGSSDCKTCPAHLLKIE